ncbi:unnamed protein product [Arabidopsis lyrata]|nr:unnamed protein product [Arabidopsis lyrata]
MSRALDKIRFESLTDKSKLDGQPELFLHIIPDKTNNTLNIIDSVIGMTKAVATPKQIRDLMKVKVDGLTNDEVKSHLHKYRLHTRRPATPVVTNGGEIHNNYNSWWWKEFGCCRTIQRIIEFTLWWRFNLHRREREVDGAANRRQHLLHTPHRLPLS